MQGRRIYPLLQARATVHTSRKANSCCVGVREFVTDTDGQPQSGRRQHARTEGLCGVLLSTRSRAEVVGGYTIRAQLK